MIRLVQKKLIIPRGDTGSFGIPIIPAVQNADIAVFTIFDALTKTKLFEKLASVNGEELTITFTHANTVNLKPGNYFWDIKFYDNPVYDEDHNLIDGDEVDSYYAAYQVPICEIRETGDYLWSQQDNVLTQHDIEIITTATSLAQAAAASAQESLTHAPKIENDTWHIWNASIGEYIDTQVDAHGIAGYSPSATVTKSQGITTFTVTDQNGTTSTTISDGITPTFSIGQVTSGTPASATITGSAAEPQLNLRIPPGAVPDINIGTVVTGAAGSNASATITGTDERPYLNLTIPRGDKGDTGSTPNLTIGTVTTGEAGSQASATISGTTDNPTLSLTIPKGDTGTNGLSPSIYTSKQNGKATISILAANGNSTVTLYDGTDGISPTASVSKSGHTATISITDKNGTTTTTVQDGNDGANGADGITPNISIGTVTEGANAYADITGTTAAPVLNLVLPKGSDGYSPAASVSKYGNTATISVTDQSGTTTAKVFDGTNGITPQFSIGTVTTGDAGTDASVTIGGTTIAPTLSFTIPKGATGAAGNDGNDGFSPLVNVSKSNNVLTLSVTDKNGTSIATITDGTNGTNGLTPNISIGTVTTLLPSQSATATITGTTPNLTLNLGIPKGETGNAGVTSVNSQTGAVTLTAADVGAGTYSKPSGGIPASDLASGVIPTVTVSVLSPTGNTHTLSPCPITYNFGEKSELTVTVTADSEYHFMFSSPSGTPTVLTMNGITGKTGPTIAAGKTYEVDVWAGIAIIREIVVIAV